MAVKKADDLIQNYFLIGNSNLFLRTKAGASPDALGYTGEAGMSQKGQSPSPAEGGSQDMFCGG